MIAKRDHGFMMLELLELFYGDDQEWGGGKSHFFSVHTKKERLLHIFLVSPMTHHDSFPISLRMNAPSIKFLTVDIVDCCIICATGATSPRTSDGISWCHTSNTSRLLVWIFANSTPAKKIT